MMDFLQKHLFSGLGAIGCVGTIATGVTNPQYLPTALMGTGGVLAGAAVAVEAGRKREQEAVEAAKVAKVFSQLYEQNKGLLIPEQLAFSADISFEKSKQFLAALAQSQGGQEIPTEGSVMYKMPHPENVLDQLTANATAWAENRSVALQNENLALKQQLASIENVIKKLNAIQAEAPKDPWQSLIK